jgi:tetratricopeptide (TPR) repeat protein
MLTILEKIDFYYDKLAEKVIDPQIDQFLIDLKNKHPERFSKITDVSLFKDQTRKLLSGEELRKKIESGIEAIIHDFQKRLSEQQIHSIQQEVLEGLSNLEKRCSEVKEEDLDRTALEDLMNLSKLTIDEIYSAGNNQFQQKAFQNAANIFFILSLINYGRHHVWLSLGLSEQQLGHHEAAIVDFAMAALTDIHSPWSFIYSAESSLHLREEKEAKAYLEQAREMVYSNASKNQNEVLESIRQLEKFLSNP